MLCAEAALDKKGTDLVVLDVREHTSIADYFVIVSGRSDTQVRSIAEQKMVDLNANDIEGAEKIIAGTARSMGITVEA